MKVDPDKVNFISSLKVDKILSTATANTSIASGSSGSPTSLTLTLTNPTGKECFITHSFSVDGTNFYSGDSQYSVNGNTLNIDAAVNKSNVIFHLTNTIGSLLTVTINYSLDNIL